MIVSTGTGSSGWLYGAKRITNFKVHNILNHLKTDAFEKENIQLFKKFQDASDTTQLEEEIANQISSVTHFEPEKDQLYYFVREPFSSTLQNEGFASDIELFSELVDGQICIDGGLQFPVEFGDRVHIDSKPEYKLKCIKFII